MAQGDKFDEFIATATAVAVGICLWGGGLFIIIHFATKYW